MTVTWGHQLVEQLEFYWDTHLWPRLAGLTDEEYLWEPVDGCWSVRPGPDGRWTLDGFNRRPPQPPPVTTIAWRMNHIAATCLANRATAFFGDPPDGADMFDPRLVPPDLPAGAADACAFLAEAYRRWHDGIAALDDAGLATPLGPRGAYFHEDPMSVLVLHVNREVMHHGGEIGLLRDLYRATGATGRDSRLAPR